MDLGLEQLQFRESRSSRLWRGIARLTHPFGTALAGVVRNNFVVAVLKGLDRAVGAPQLVRSTHDMSDADPA